MGRKGEQDGAGREAQQGHDCRRHPSLSSTPEAFLSIVKTSGSSTNGAGLLCPQSGGICGSPWGWWDRP